MGGIDTYPEFFCKGPTRPLYVPDLYNYCVYIIAHGRVKIRAQPLPPPPGSHQPRPMFHPPPLAQTRVGCMDYLTLEISKHLSAFLINRPKCGINLPSVLHFTKVVGTYLLAPPPVYTHPAISPPPPPPSQDHPPPQDGLKKTVGFCRGVNLTSYFKGCE